MNVKKEQKIVVFVTLTADDKNLILNGIRLANIFKKELCLVFPLAKRQKKDRDHISTKINEYLIPLAKEMSFLKATAFTVEEKLIDLPEVLADDYEAIMLVARASDYKKFSAAVIHSPVPFLFVDPAQPLSALKK